jgi:hypothetical protein
MKASITTSGRVLKGSRIDGEVHVGVLGYGSSYEETERLLALPSMLSNKLRQQKHIAEPQTRTSIWAKNDHKFFVPYSGMGFTSFVSRSTLSTSNSTWVVILEETVVSFLFRLTSAIGLCWIGK